MTHSYVYHPNFLALDVGGGPIREDNTVDFSGEREEAGDNLFNFTGKASFLRNKPIRGSVFYDHLNPTVSVAPGEIMVQENSRYGFDMAMSNPAVGLPLNFGFVQMQTRGDSESRIQDDDLDQFYFDIGRSYDEWGSSNLQYHTADQTSRSGSVNLPIQETESNDKDVNVDTRLQFGDNEQYYLTNNVFYNTRTYSQTPGDLPDQSDFGLLLDLRALPSDELSLFGNYHHNLSDQGDVDTVRQQLASGLTYLPLPDVETSLGISLDKEDADQYAIDSGALDGSILYRRALWVGELQTSYDARYELRDQQESSDPLVSVINEQHTLSGTTQVSLSQSNVEADSVIVANLTQTQIYIENVDYRLVIVGSTTRIERLVSGNILDGETVLVDYVYDIGGTYDATQFDQTLSVNWTISRYLESYLRFFKSSPEVTSGISTYPLNSIDSVVLGSDAEVPLPLGLPFSVGGSFEYENHDETISPFTRTASDIFLQSSRPLFDLANMRLSGRRSHIDYDVSAEDVDLNGYELRLWTRRFGIELNGVLAYEEDTGSPIPRTRRDLSLNAVWRERKVTVTATVLDSAEKQGYFKRDHILFRLTARRDL